MIFNGKNYRVWSKRINHEFETLFEEDILVVDFIPDDWNNSKVMKLKRALNLIMSTCSEDVVEYMYWIVKHLIEL